MLLHPDRGGTDDAFRELEEQYRDALSRAISEPILPVFYHVDKAYEYQRRPVQYIGRDNHYYNFRFVSGGFVSVDVQHMGLIFVRLPSLA